MRCSVRLSLILLSFLGSSLAQTSASTQAPRLRIAKGTPIDLRLETPLSSVDARKGDEVRLVVTQPLMQSDKVLIPAGAIATAKVIEEKHARGHCSNGRVRFNIDNLTLSDGVKVPLRFAPPRPTANAQKGMSTGDKIGAAIGMTMLAPVALLELPFAVGMYYGERGSCEAHGVDEVHLAGEPYRVLMDSDLEILPPNSPQPRRAPSRAEQPAVMAKDTVEVAIPQAREFIRRALTEAPDLRNLDPGVSERTDAALRLIVRVELNNRQFSEAAATAGWISAPTASAEAWNDVLAVSIAKGADLGVRTQAAAAAVRMVASGAPAIQMGEEEKLLASIFSAHEQANDTSGAEELRSELKDAAAHLQPEWLRGSQRDVLAEAETHKFQLPPSNQLALYLAIGGHPTDHKRPIVPVDDQAADRAVSEAAFEEQLGSVLEEHAEPKAVRLWAISWAQADSGEFERALHAANLIETDDGPVRASALEHISRYQTLLTGQLPALAWAESEPLRNARSAALLGVAEALLERLHLPYSAQ